MVRTVVKNRLETDDRIAGKGSLLNGFLKTLFNGGEVVLRNGTADNLGFKDQLVTVMRFKTYPDVTVLTGAAGLLLMSALYLTALSDGFSVCYLRNLETDLNAEFCFQFCDNDIKMLFAETRKNHFSCLFVVDECYSRIFAHDTAKAGSNLIFLALLLDNDCHGKRRLREINALEFHDILRGADRVAGCKAGKLCNNADVAGCNSGNIFLLVAADGNQFAHSFAFAGSCVISRNVGGKLTADNLDEGHLTDKRVGNGLEADCRNRAVRVTLDVDFVVVVIKTLFVRRRKRIGSGINNCVKKKVNTVGIVAGASVYGINLAAFNALGKAVDDFFSCQLFALKEFHHQIVVDRSDGFHENVFHFLHTVIGRHSDFGCLAFVVRESFVGAKVYVADNLSVFNVRNNNRTQLCAELFFQSVERFEEVAVFAVKLGDDEELGKSSCVGGFDCLFCAYVKAGTCRSYDKGTACGSHRFVYAALKVKFSGGVKKIDFGVSPFKRSHGGRKRTLTLLFFGVKVHYGISVGDSSESVGSPRDIKHCFGKSGLALSGVTGDGNVSDFIGAVRFQSNYLPELSENTKPKLVYSLTDKKCLLFSVTYRFTFVN